MRRKKPNAEQGRTEEDDGKRRQMKEITPCKKTDYREQTYGHQGAKGGWDKLGDWDRYIYIYIHTVDTMYELGSSGGEECLPCRRSWFHSWVGKICWRREPTPVFWLAECHGLYRIPWSHEESDTTEQLPFTSLHEISN